MRWVCIPRKTRSSARRGIRGFGGNRVAVATGAAIGGGGLVVFVAVGAVGVILVFRLVVG
jgi:hypothetical protein